MALYTHTPYGPELEKQEVLVLEVTESDNSILAINYNVKAGQYRVGTKREEQSMETYPL
ncbi:hypothetical protein Glove_306g42 [Diversispora epigaea]|uniref:Uncharacterized protein n=1 Tax=Diversispora epigaea TaxID=1348612 RepID=A0A397HX54_9GLOM|nr:hypothetical protein Glove_306g42 [Diversispora epigaea]